jgi:hypothetical protein
MGFAGVASIGAAAGGFAASQSQSDVVSVVTPRPPMVEPLTAERVAALALTEPATDLDRWAAAFMDQPAALIAQADVKPWRFVGVIGEGRGARAVFAAPDNPGQTMMAKQGDALPDGRVVAAIASEHVLFAATQAGPGGVAAATGLVGPKQISLFNAGAGNKEAADAYANFAASRSGPIAAAMKTASAGGYVRSDDGGYAPPSWVAPPASAN